MDFTAGTEVRQYRLIRRLGSGASGEVWEAQNVVYRSTAVERDVNREEEGKRYAIKFMHETLINSPDADIHRDRLTNEIRALELLKSTPNIPVLVDYDLGFFRPYLVMDFVKGPAWDTLIQSGEMFFVPIKQRLDCLQQLATAIANIHQSGFIHRDIKPGNIHGIDDPIILDFSIAFRTRQYGSELVHNRYVPDPDAGYIVETGVGTGIYMPPLEDPIDVFTDNYAFCLVAYEVLFGQHAIFTPDLVGETVEDTRMVTSDRIQKRTWHLPSRILPEGMPVDLKGADIAFLDAIFEKALGKYDTRYQSLDEFMTDLRDAILIPENEPFIEQHANMSPPKPRYMIPQEKRYTVNEVQRSHHQTNHGIKRPTKKHTSILSLQVIIVLLAFASLLLLLALAFNSQ